MVPREVIFGIDQTERRLSFALAGLGGLLAIALFSFTLFGHEYTTKTAKQKAGGGCLTGYHLPAHEILCTKSVLANLDGLSIEVAFIAFFVAALGFFAWRRQRVGVIFTSLFLGVALLSEYVGLLFLFLGGWVALRAWRLHKYGEASMAGVAGVAKERAVARREGRAPKEPAPPPKPKEPAGPRAPAKASKRYTPKKPKRKQRVRP